MFLPEGPSRLNYRGFVSVDGADYGITVHLPQHYVKGSSLRGTKMILCEELSALLEPFKSVLDRKCELTHDVSDLFVEIQELAARAARGSTESSLKKQKRAGMMRDAEFYTRLVGEIEDKSLGVVGISENLDQITLRSLDVAGRSHEVIVSLPQDYPSSSPTCFADIPSALNVVNWDPKTSGLRQVQQQFQQLLSTYQDFWNVLDVVDKNLWVLGETSSRSVCSRRIVLKSHCYLHITIDPKHPSAIPQMKFLGADKVAQPLMEALNKKSHEWNAEKSILENLEHCLGMKLPPKPGPEESGDLSNNSCGICYEFHLENDSVPEVVCSSARCGKCFHRVCLADWLRAIPTTKVSFSTIFGSCPFCEQNLSFVLPSTSVPK